MAISYPIDMPVSSSRWSRIDFGMDDAVAVSRSPDSFKQKVRSSSGQQWRLIVTLPNLTVAEAAPWRAFLAKLRGQEGTFTYRDYMHRTAQGTPGGSPKVDGASQTGWELNTKDWSTSTEVLKEGDFIQIDNSLYMVLEDATTDGSGDVTLDVWPSLRTHSDNATITYSSPGVVMRLTDSFRSWSEPNPAHVTIAFSAEEALA